MPMVAYTLYKYKARASIRCWERNDYASAKTEWANEGITTVVKSLEMINALRLITPLSSGADIDCCRISDNERQRRSH